MRTTVCRVLQVLLLGIYAIGVLIVISGIFGIATDLVSSFIGTDTMDYRNALAQVGFGAILTYTVKGAERLLVAVMKPGHGKLIALLERPLSSFFKQQMIRN